jgi:trigger factor
VVEHHVANVRVVSSNLITRYFLQTYYEASFVAKNKITEDKKADVAVTEKDVVTEFTSKDFSVTMKQALHCRVLLTVTVTPKATEAAYKKGIKKINKEISVPGFRKGKAPEALVIKNYKSHIEDQWRDLLLHTSFNEAMKLTKIYPFNEKSFRTSKVDSSSLDDGSVVVFEYESEPQVPRVDLKKLELKKVDPVAVDDKAIDERIEQLRERYVDWKECEEDHIAVVGDHVNLTVVSLEEKESENKELCNDTRFLLDEAEMSPWMIKLVTGLKKGGTVEGVSELDERLDEKAKKEFVSTKCAITLVSINKRILPDIDEEFAKKLGCTTVEELRENVRKQCEGEGDNDVKEALREQVEALILEKYDFDLPSSLIEAERKIRIRNKIRQLKEQKKSAEEISSLEQDIEKDVAKEVHNVLRFFFLVRNIAVDNMISVTDEDIDKEMVRERLYWYMFNKGKEFDEKDPDLRSKLYANILTTKVKDFLIDKSKIV